MIKNEFLNDNVSYPVHIHNIDDNIDSNLISNYSSDFINLLTWSKSIEFVSDLKIEVENLSMLENRDDSYIISVNLSFKLNSNILYNSKEIKEIIQTQGIRFSKGNRYWFLFEMEKNYIQLFIFPYYKYQKQN